MRISLLSLFFLFLTLALAGQAPVNDNCAGAIDLGVLPADCSGQIYNNVNATASGLGAGNIPNCFNGGNVNRDVYFTFTTNDTLRDVSIILQGTDAGANGPITNPQVAIYRGDCVGGLAFLGFCLSAPSGSNQLQLDVLGLTPNTTYYLLVNDYSATAAPNSGDFTLCVEEYVPAVNIGDAPGSSSCFGTLYDDGGPDGDYGSNQNHTFVIEPAEFNQCIEISVLDFQLEDNFDFVNIYAGDNTNGPLLATLNGFSSGQPFVIQSASSAVTVEFFSDGSVQQGGFELTWSCSPLACDGSSFDNPIPISGLPFNQGGYSTCDDASNLTETPCTQAPFLFGPEVVFAYESAGGFCANVQVTGATPGTGIVVLDGPPDDPETQCLAQTAGGQASSVDFQDAGTYYIVVANGQGCTDFGLSITESSCSLNPSLLGSLCNPLNGCIDPSGLPSTFVFNQGFEDITFTPGVNDGCWLNTGSAQPNYYWFSIEAQADGPFGFIVQAATPGEESDIDFNVWGPFDRQQVCEEPLQVRDLIESTQPIRSSWAAGADPTGLAAVNANGEPVTDPYDCDPAPGAFGDDFASVIMAEQGEVYLVLINDWGNDIASGAISVDWGPSDPPVLGALSTDLIQMDTAICAGESVQLLVEAPVETITWITNTETLSCTDCPDPVATPDVTTTYTAIAEAVCFIDTFQITVQVYEVDAGPDLTVCLNEDIQLDAGSDLLFAEFQWTAPGGVTLSCTDCPNPFVTADAPGTYELSVTLSSINCTIGDQMTLTVLDVPAPEYTISDGEQICIGESVNIGGPAGPGLTYSWTSEPAGFTANVSDPQVSPTESTTYFLEVTGPDCPVPSFDSVLVEIFLPPQVNITGDTSICQEDPVVLGNTEIEPDVTYTWTGPPTIEDPTDPNTLAFPSSDGTYTLTAVRGACTVVESFDVIITPVAIEILDANMAPIPDTVRICRGEEVALNTSITPADSTALWTSTEIGFDTLVAPGLTVSPQSAATYYAEISLSNSCFRIDSVVILVDSLPSDMAIMPEDTTVCEGALVLLTSPVYEPADFLGIEFLWSPANGQETPDSLYNMVIRAQGEEQTIYQRVATSGVCTDTSFATINVNPTPVVSIDPNNATICAGDQVQLTGTVDENTTEFEWIAGGESLSCTDCLNPVATPGMTTTYTLEAKNEDCPATASATVEVVSPPAILLNTQTAVCPGESVQLNLNFDANAIYTWTATDPNFGTVVDPQLVVTPNETTTYFLTADNGVCTPVSAEITINVIGDVTLSISASDDFLCFGEQAILTAEVIGGTPEDTFNWEGSDGSTFSGNPITVSPSGLTVYTLTYQDAAGCQVITDSVTVDVEGEVSIDEILIDPDTTMSTFFLGEQAFLTVDYFTDLAGPLNFTWTRDDSLITSGPGLESIGETFLTPGDIVYEVTITTPNGCEYSAETVITVVIPKVDVPSAFTPNGDSHNDYFNIVLQGNPANLIITEFKVFNRWGQLVYNNENPDLGWDGNFNGEPQPSEVYFYMISVSFANGEAHPDSPLRGDVTLLR